MIDDAALVGLFQKGQQAQQGGLAAAVVAHQGQHLAAVDAQLVHAQGGQVQRGHTAVTAHQAADFVQKAHMRPRCLMKVMSTLMAKAMNSSTRPSAMPWANSPLLVSRAMAVVMVRVW